MDGWHPFAITNQSLPPGPLLEAANLLPSPQPTPSSPPHPQLKLPELTFATEIQPFCTKVNTDTKEQQRMLSEGDG